MTFWKPMVVALVLGAAAAPGVLSAQSPKPVEEYPFVVTPLKGLALDAGGKHVVGMYVANDGACHLTVAIADRSIDGAEIPAAGSRMQTAVAGGQAVRIDLADGPSLEFFCAKGAGSLTARMYQRTAGAVSFE